jgi:8-oxo-dGTP pyrophosphatase MutT (NUDIX family)
MQRVTDQSFGVVPVTKEGSTWRVLLVKQISPANADEAFWTFPKGHAETGEYPLETATRELIEETGLRQISLIESAQFPIVYTFSHEGQLIEKTVTYFLGICTNSATAINMPEEIADVAWLTFSEAENRLTHQNTKQVLEATQRYLDEHQQ